MPGYDVQVLDEDGHEVPAGTTGRHRDQAAAAAGQPADALERRGALPQDLPEHFPGYYETGDAGYIDEDGYLYIMARTDDIINVAGHRLSTGAMEEVLAAHPDVAECAVIGVADELKGQVPIGFVCLNAGVERAARRDRRRVRRRWCASRSARSPPSSTALRRGPAAQDPLGQDPARHDAARSPTARTTRCPRPSTTRRSSTRSPRRLREAGYAKTQVS